MNEGDIKREIQRAWEWQQDEANALCNSLLWLTQAANNETPHGGIQSCLPAPDAGEKSNSTMTLPNHSTTVVPTTPTATETATCPTGLPTGTSGVESEP